MNHVDMETWPANCERPRCRVGRHRVRHPGGAPRRRVDALTRQSIAEAIAGAIAGAIAAGVRGRHHGVDRGRPTAGGGRQTAGGARPSWTSSAARRPARRASAGEARRARARPGETGRADGTARGTPRRRRRRSGSGRRSTRSRSGRPAATCLFIRTTRRPTGT